MELDRGRPAAAAAAFERALAVDPASAAALAGAGRAALAARDAGRAVGYLERALAIAPSAAGLHYNLGMAHRALGDLDAARAHLARRGDGLPAPPDPLMDVYNGLLRSALAYEIRGMRAMDARRFDEAAAIFRDGLAETPEDASLRHRLGTALMLAGDAAGAVEQFEATLRVAPDFEKAHFGIGVILGMNGRHAEAIARYAAAGRIAAELPGGAAGPGRSPPSHGPVWKSPRPSSPRRFASIPRSRRPGWCGPSSWSSSAGPARRGGCGCARRCWSIRVIPILVGLLAQVETG